VWLVSFVDDRCLPPELFTHTMPAPLLPPRHQQQQNNTDARRRTARAAQAGNSEIDEQISFPHNQSPSQAAFSSDIGNATQDEDSPLLHDLKGQPELESSSCQKRVSIMYSLQVF
jgi:hypothetical protein